ncbi:exodeoxyribonuclease VII small subunit [Neisseria sp. Ec49-e6-T10]|uniref:exodeoxyribonuclease VII small subunit n=1 Tax=Neisseria sp. Ec49-e6-T10 TaxID=3140744 RepID=UPI003EB954A2
MSKNTEPKTFEEAMTQLEQITASMQNNDLPLEQALNAYKEGGKLIQFCQKRLSEVEEQLKMFDGNKLVDLPETDN